jgi:hypothetical protein
MEDKVHTKITDSSPTDKNKIKELYQIFFLKKREVRHEI